ncbi:hypothetical protein HY993_02875 [Candidatus Micrarchaeota archaeon]|nr:hypothetical protein [Candidatus Micrarchaeota archaeon]
MDELSGLIQLGLSEHQARTYLTLLRTGEASVNKIARESGIHPRSTYDCLDALVSKGLATYSEKEGTKMFCAYSLDSLMALVEEKKSVVEQLLPILEGQLRKNNVPLVRVFNGRNGMRAVWEDLLKVGQPIYFYGGAMQGFRIYLKEYTKRWNTRREKLGIPVKGIFVNKPEVFSAFKGFKLWQAKPLPEKLYSSVAWWLYGNKMALVFMQAEPLVILIESPDLANTYRNFFNLAWKTAGKK